MRIDALKATFVAKIGAFTIVMTVLTPFFGYSQINPENIEIIRDKWGVPHIHGGTDAETAYGLAWAHAEDDFYNIQLTMTAAKQLLGSYLGKEGAQADFVVGLIKAEEIVEEHYDDLSDEYKAVLDGYVQGINAFAKKHPKEVLVKKAFPLTAKEALRGYVLQLSVFDGAGRAISQILDGSLPNNEEITGSNAFALNGKKTEGDNVFLAINSHQPLEGPAAWYEAHLISDNGWNMMGGLFPGGTTVFLGTNENLGWAHTVNYFDKVDVFQLEMDKEDELKYRFDDEWLELEERELVLKVKILPGIKIPIKRKVYWSVYGPTLKNDNGTYSFHVSALDEIRAPDQWFHMNKATNLEEFKEALEIQGIPSFNIVYGDKEGNIYYIGNALVAERDPTYNWRSTLPGNTSKTLNESFHPLSDLPTIENPECGYVFNTNHSAFYSTCPESYLDDKIFDETMGYPVWHNNRSLRFTELMEDQDNLDWKDFLQAKYDNKLPDSLCFLIDVNGLFELDPKKIRRGKEVLMIIQNWDRKADINSVGSVHFKLFYEHLRGKLNAPRAEIYKPSSFEFLESLAYVESYLLKHFGKLEVSLADFQFLKRGDLSKPVWGLPDVITAMHTVKSKEGRVKVTAGESYIMMVKYSKEGLPEIETVNVFGASSRKESQHFNDQMDMFIDQKLKPMTLDLEEVRSEAVKIYSPK